MRCGKPANVSLILIGLQQVGVNGLRQVIEAAIESKLSGREAITEEILSRLRDDNYIPDSQLESFRTAIWREYLRHRGEDFQDFYSEVCVTVRGEPGPEREQFLETLRSVFADFELKPVADSVAPIEAGAPPELLIEGETVVRGCIPRAAFKTAVRKRITEW